MQQQQQQQPPPPPPPQQQQMIPSMSSSFPSTNITTEQIQKYLEENKKLILEILENQKLGKLHECAQYQAQLQKNLMYLAAIADAQPQAPSLPPQQGGYSMQHPQAALAQRPGAFAGNMPLQFNNPHQIQDPRMQQHIQQYQQVMQGQIGMGPGGISTGMHPMHTGTAMAGGGTGAPPPNTGSNDARGGSRQDASEAGSSGADIQGSSAAGRAGDGNGDSKVSRAS